MKILKTPNTHWSYKYTCSGCDAELEVEKGDLKYTMHDQDFRDPCWESWEAECPICQITISVPTSKIPKIVQVEIKKGLPPADVVWPNHGNPMDH